MGSVFQVARRCGFLVLDLRPRRRQGLLISGRFVFAGRGRALSFDVSGAVTARRYLLAPLLEEWRLLLLLTSTKGLS